MSAEPADLAARVPGLQLNDIVEAIKQLAGVALSCGDDARVVLDYASLLENNSSMGAIHRGSGGCKDAEGVGTSVGSAQPWPV
jgi:hypothetical protein